MSGYQSFALFYDRLTADVDYRARAGYFAGLIADYAARPVELLLDLCCGTGSLSAELSLLGYDMICADASPEMLSAAAAKEYKAPPLFLCQRAEELDLYGTIDACVCALDSLNHLAPEAMERAVSRVSLFLAPGGVFVFDVNTRYKHREILADHAFVYDTDDVFCVWRNHCRKNGDVEIALDFFIPGEGTGYSRASERFTEHLFSPEELESAIEKAGLELLALYQGDTRLPPSKTSQRAVYVTRKPL